VRSRSRHVEGHVDAGCTYSYLYGRAR
jgi:hypothetical protein